MVVDVPPGTINGDTPDIVVDDNPPIVVLPEEDEVRGTIRSDNRIVLNGSADILGLEFTSQEGLLDGGTNESPFGFFLSNTPERVTLGVLGAANAVRLDGELTLAVGYTGDDPATDLTASWGQIDGSFVPLPITRDSNNDCVDPSLDTIDDCSNGDLSIRDRILEELDLPLGDVTGDGGVDFADFLAITNNFAKETNYKGGDFDLDGRFDFSDFLIFAENFGLTRPN